MDYGLLNNDFTVNNQGMNRVVGLAHSNLMAPGCNLVPRALVLGHIITLGSHYCNRTVPGTVLLCTKLLRRCEASCRYSISTIPQNGT